MNLKKGELKTRIISVGIVLIVLALVIFPSFGSAVLVNLLTDKTTYQDSDDLVTFNVSIDIDDSELVPIQNITLYINDTLKTCSFYVNGTILNGCSNIQIPYVYVDISSYDYGYGYGADYNSIGTNFGYGYGYGGTGLTGYTGELRYIIEWNITAENLTNGQYGAEIQVYALNGATFYVYEQASINTFTVNKSTQSNTAPVITPIQNQEAIEDQLFTYQATASDTDGDIITYSLTNEPAGMTINTTSGLITWTPNNAQALAQDGIYAVSVTASDSQLTDTKNFTITVTQVNDAPTISGIPDLPTNQTINVTEDIDYTLNVTPYILDIDTNTSLLTISTSSSYATINDKIITFNYPNGITSEEVRITVSDSQLTASDNITVTIVPVNDTPTTPTIDLTPDSPDVDEDLTCSITEASTDVDSETIYYNYTWKVNGAIQFSNTTTSISTTLDSSNTGTNQNWSCEVYAYDGSLTSSTTSDLVQINHTAPTDLDTVDVIPNVARTNSTLTCFVNGSNTNNYVYQWKQNGVLTNHTTQNITSGNLSVGDTWICIARAYDNISYSAPASDEVTIINTKPIISSPTPSTTTTTTSEGTPKSFSITTSDIDSQTISTTWYKGTTVVATGNSYTFPASYTSAGTHTIKAIVSDGLLTTERTWTLTVTDTNRNASIETIGAQSCDERSNCQIQISATDPDSDNTIKYYDNSTLFTINPTTGLINFTPENVASTTNHPIRITVVDNAGGYDTQTFTLTINNVNRNPVLDSIGTITAVENNEFTYTATGSDVDGDSLTFTDNTSLFNITSAGIITFTPTQGNVGNHSIRITVSDGNGGTDYEDITVAVLNTNNAPTITTSTPTSSTPSIAEAESQLFTVTATDVDGTTPNIKWYVNDTFNKTGSTFNFTTGYLSKGNYLVKATVDDGLTSTSRTWTLIVTDTNRAPVISSISNVDVAEDSTFTYTVSASDQDSDNTLVYSDNTSLFNIGLLNGIISFTPNQSQIGVHDVIIYVADGTTRSSTTFTINVTNVNDAPVLNLIGGLTAIESSTFTYTVSASDQDSNTLTYSDNTPLFNINSSTGIISFTPTYQDQGTYPVRISVSDGNGGTDYEDITLTVLNENQDPVITTTSPIENTSMKEDSSTTFNVSYNDPDGTTPGVTWYLDGFVVAQGTDEYTFEGDFTAQGTNAGEYNITVAVSDGLSTTTYDWNLTVNRTRDSDIDNIPDYRDNCPLIYNPDQTDLDGSTTEGLLCENNADGDELLDDEDFLEGNSDNIDSNIENLGLKVDNNDDTNRQINDSNAVTFTITDYNTTTGAATERTVVNFTFNFTNSSKLNLGNVSIRKQASDADAGEAIISGIDLSSQNQTKTVYVDDIDETKNSICIKDAEIASVRQISGTCTGDNETKLACNPAGHSKTFQGNTYTCTDEGSYLKVEGLVHSGVLEDTCTSSWTCDSWSTCSSGSQTCASWTDSNNCGRTYTGSNTRSCSTSDTGSGSLTIDSDIPEKAGLTWVHIYLGEEKIFDVNNDNLFVTTIKFVANKDLSSVRMVITEVLNIEKQLQGNVYKYVSIDKQNMDNEDFNSALINFKVAKTWLSSNKLKTSEIALYRLTDTWSELPTTFVSQDGDYAYYTAETPGFSYFAVSIKGETPGTTKPVVAINETAPFTDEIIDGLVDDDSFVDNKGTIQVPSEKSNVWWNVLIFVVFLVIIAGIISYIIFRSKRD
ncbi:tandem-95 repeat protein [Candidatus Woesearchaeota archaeon]|nr:tandem-95 repeat protein [Candidatus Woesearchaeota archaeon]